MGPTDLPQQRDQPEKEALLEDLPPQPTGPLASIASSSSAPTSSETDSPNDRTPPTGSSAPFPGRNVSGRNWKLGPHKRASTLVKTVLNNQAKSWSVRQAERQQHKEVKQLQKDLQEEKKQALLLKKERRLANEKRRAENELKAMEKSVQTLNVRKVGTTLKAMSKKQLRQIKKSRVNPKTGVVEYVPAYAK